ncbi:tRNA lysidine(34) synthetase TilS [bacterium]|nr:MAG: tRNA lysidine(34) synthetase TilS [bacterium]
MIDIKKELNKYRIDLKDQDIIIGVSGGPDSMCLLHNITSCDCNIIVCHVNYGLRGKDSDKDEILVKEFCEKNKIKWHIIKYTSKKHDENTLRDFRYDFFREISVKYSTNFIAVAHNSNDQAETILMNFIRGASLRGLGGMKFISEDIIRPLLHISRDEIMEYLKKHNIPYRIDKTNENNDFFRNKIRNELIPLLSVYNPNILNSLNRNSEVFRDLQQFIDDYAILLLASIGIKKENSIEIDYKRWVLLPKAIKIEVLKQTIMKIMGNLQDLQAVQLKEITEMLTNKVPYGKKKLLKNLSIEEKYGKIVVKKINR